MSSDLGLLQLQLSFQAHFRHNQMTAVTSNLFVSQKSGSGFGQGACASCDARHDGESLAPFQAGRVILQVADVLIVDIYVDEAAQLALIIEQILLNVGILLGQMAQGIGHGRAAHFYRFFLAGELAQGGRDQDFGHINSSSSAFVWSRSGRKLRA